MIYGKCLAFLVLAAFFLPGIGVPMAKTSGQANPDESAPTRPRARDLGIRVGILPLGPLNAITDVNGVMVGHTTIVRGDNVRTGVTAILPHNGNLFREKVPGAVVVGNGFGKLMGSSQVNELGEIETPVLLTSTLSVPRVADAVLDYMLGLAGNETLSLRRQTTDISTIFAGATSHAMMCLQQSRTQKGVQWRKVR